MNIHAAEADLISAAVHGPSAVYGMLLTKLAELELDAGDRLALLDALEDVEQKNASATEKQAFMSPNVVRALAVGSMIAAPVSAGVSALMDARRKAQGYEALHQVAPEVMQDPVRSKAMYDLLYSAAPNVATNTPVAADLLRQMSAQPNIDLGTVGRLSDIRKNMMTKGDGGSGVMDGVKNIGTIGTAANVLNSGTFPGKSAGATIRANHIALDGTACFFNWAAEPMKQAGLTDAFSGSGTPMEQASQAYDMGQQTQQYPLMPLDAVVRELLMKEQELMQREQVLAQQEQMMQQAQGVQGQMAGAYQNEFGVDPTTGQPMAEDDAPHGEQPAGGEQMPEGMEQPEGAEPGEAPEGMEQPEMGAAPEGAAPEGAEQPAMEYQDPQAGQDPTETGPGEVVGGAPEQLGGEQASAGGADLADVDGTATNPTVGRGLGEDAGAPTDPADAAAMPQGSEEFIPEAAAGEEAPSPAEANPPGELTGADVEGSVEDEASHHQGPGALPEGSPEDLQADEQLAQQMNEAGAAPTPLEGAPAAPAAMSPEAPAAQPPVSLGAPAPGAAPTAVPDGMGGMSVTIPLPSIQLSLKLAELDKRRDELLNHAMANFFRG